VVSLTRLPAAAVVLLAFVLTAQLAFTGIGLEIGPHWSEPETLDSTTGPTGKLVDVAATADSDGNGRVAWIVTEAGEYRIRVANATAQDGQLSIGERRTLVRTDNRLASVDVARRNGTTAVVWRRHEANEAMLALEGARSLGPTRVSSNDSLRARDPTVALVSGTPVVAYRGYARSTSSWVGVLAVGASEPRYTEFGEGIGTESVSPAVSAGPTGATVAWVDTDETAAEVAPLTRSADGTLTVGEPTTVGRSRTLRSMSGTGQLAEVQLSTAGSGSVLLWTDLGSVQAVPLSDGAPAAEPTDLGGGQNPSIGAGDGRWLATTMVQDRASGIDVRYTLVGEGATESGMLSRLASTAVRADTAFAPDPFVAWVESGQEKRLLVSAYQAKASSGPLQRLTANPARFGFLVISALALGAVTLPMMPWVAGPLLAGFFLTTRVVLQPVTQAGSRLSALSGRERSPMAIRKGIQTLPGWLPALLFAAVNTLLLVAILGGSGENVAGVPFAHPIGVSLLALLAAGLTGALFAEDSPWKLAAIFGFFQTVGLWATALPNFI